MSRSDMTSSGEIARLRSLLDEFVERSTGERAELREESVSAWSVGEQVEHIALATEHSLRAVALISRGGDERIVPDGEPSPEAAVVLLRERIPRGRASAPEVVRPRACDETELAAGFDRCREILDGVAESSDGEIAAWTGRVAHPILGPLSATEWLRFTRIHAEHHRRIIDEIEAAAPNGASGESI